MPDENEIIEPIINRCSNTPIIWPRDNVKHSIAEENSTTRKSEAERINRQQTDHYETINVLRRVLEDGVFIEEHGNKIVDGKPEKHGKTSERAYRIFVPVRLNGENLVVVRLIVLRVNNEFQL